MSDPLIFVYGSLLKPIQHRMHRTLSAYADFVAEGVMQGKLYEVDGYPGAIRSSASEDKVYGEIYRIKSEALFAILDKYEEITDAFPAPHEYLRSKEVICLADGTSVNAWVYVYNRDVSRLKRIPSGNYLTFLNSQQD